MVMDMVQPIDVNAMLRMHHVAPVRYLAVKLALFLIVSEWFLERLDATFPEDTRDLIEDYWTRWKEAIVATETLTIESMMDYAGIVEHMHRVNWTKPGTYTYAARKAGRYLKGHIHDFIKEAKVF